MAWSISNAMMRDYENSLSSQAPAGASSEATCSDGAQSVQSSTTPMPDQYYWPDKTTEHSRLSRFGMTCVPLTASRGEDLLTWFRAGFPARTLVQPAKAQDSKESEAACGVRWQGSLARYDREASLWRTAQCSLVEGLDVYSETWPRWGSMRNGASYLRPIPELRTSENESGLWPTLCASDNSDRKVSESVHMTKSGLPKHIGKDGQKSQMRLSQAVKMKLLPTLTVCGNYNRPGASKTSGMGLATAVAMLPTLCARDWKHPGKSRIERTGSKAGEVLPQIVGGPLNPDWCEWFMGAPIGLTELKPLAICKFREWQQQHGGF